MTIGQLKQLIDRIPDDAIVGAFVDGDPQGHSIIQGQGMNDRENIFWLRAVKKEEPPADDDED